LLLCVVLTFVIPISTGYAMIVALRSGELDVVGTVYAFVYLALAGFSFAAGVSLWLVLPNAVTTAKLFLLAQAAFALADFVMLFLRNRSIALDPNLILSILIRPLLFAVLWYSYLIKSKRVRDTYRQDYSVVTKDL